MAIQYISLLHHLFYSLIYNFISLCGSNNKSVLFTLCLRLSPLLYFGFKCLSFCSSVHVTYCSIFVASANKVFFCQFKYLHLFIAALFYITFKTPLFVLLGAFSAPHGPYFTNMFLIYCTFINNVCFNSVINMIINYIIYILCIIMFI